LAATRTSARDPEQTRTLPPRLAATATRTASSGAQRTGGSFSGATRFSNFPARTAAGEPRASAPRAAQAAPAPRPAPAAPRTQARNQNQARSQARQPQASQGRQQVTNLQPIRPTFQNDQVNLPQFTSFSQGQGSGLQGRAPASAQPLRPAPQLQSRPALTFQDSRPAVQPAQNIPKSALEIVDFNQLVKEFQGSRSQGSRNAFQQRQAALASNPQRSAPSFQSLGFENFPVRY